ncbi:hypothetical protein OG741_01055 [Streptomyces sp. NBC_01410]|uniref:hypothetical protein n=1 Tax=Streptomyces sp. NBC_01410 TaxID=2903856 RepID=UPI00324F131B
MVFWGTRDSRRGWGCTPLDANGDPLLTTATPLPVHPAAAPAALADWLPRLFAGTLDELTPGRDSRTGDRR